MLREDAGVTAIDIVQSCAPRGPRPLGASAPIDALFAIGLAIVALVVRYNIPNDGLWYDDAWVALGARHASPSNLITMGQSHPGFTSALALWSRVVGDGAASLVTPTLIAGMLGPPALYLGLRRFGQARSIAALLGAALVAAPTHVEYSSRVKPYTVDVLIILVLAGIVSKVAVTQWTRSVALGWLLTAVVLGAISPFALVGAASAGIVLALHGNDDRRLRITTVGLQLVIHAGYFAVVSRTYSASALSDYWRVRADAFIDATANPVTLGREVIEHLYRVVAVYPGGPTWLVSVTLVAAAVGLVVVAWRGPHSLLGRFFLAVVLCATAGAVAGKLPFGPSTRGGNGRASLWLAPVVAVGVATVLARTRACVAPRRGLVVTFDTVVFVAAALIVVGAIGDDYHYPASGSRAASRFVMSQLTPEDAVLITPATIYSFALDAGTPVRLRPTPHRQPGYFPQFSDARVHYVERSPRPRLPLDALTRVNRVYVEWALADRENLREYRMNLAYALRFAGFARAETVEVGTAEVDIWRRCPMLRCGAVARDA